MLLLQLSLFSLCYLINFNKAIMFFENLCYFCLSLVSDISLTLTNQWCLFTFMLLFSLFNISNLINFNKVMMYVYFPFTILSLVAGTLTK